LGAQAAGAVVVVVDDDDLPEVHATEPTRPIRTSAAPARRR
jgi:hypothetical protein